MQHDLREYQERTAALLDEVQLLKKESENNKGLKEYIEMQRVELEQAKNKLSHQIKTIERLEQSLKEQTQEKTRMILDER